MDKSTLSNYGWLVIVTLILAVMLAFATPFGTYVGDGVTNIANAYVSANNKQISDDNLEYTGYQWDNKLDVLNPKGVIPADAVYYSEVGATKLGDYSTASATYKEGDRFPEVRSGDVYVFGDYEYRYGYVYNIHSIGWSICSKETDWHFRVLDDEKQYYDNILESINDNHIIGAEYAFSQCYQLVKSPKLPNTITNLKGTFYSCKKLETAPELPPQTTSLGDTFHSCKSLKIAPKIPNTLNILWRTFAYCENLEVAPDIPDKIQKLEYTFQNCYNLKTAPIIHKNVQGLSYAFAGCKNLTGNIHINSKYLSAFPYCFENVDFQLQKITLKGSISSIDELGFTGLNYCNTCNGYCTCGNY